MSLHMDHITDPKKIKAGSMYYLSKRGAWYRPKAQGYTDSLASAGLYSAREARERVKGTGGAVSAVSQKAARAAIWQEMRMHLKRAANLSDLAAII